MQLLSTENKRLKVLDLTSKRIKNSVWNFELLRSLKLLSNAFLS